MMCCVAQNQVSFIKSHPTFSYTWINQWILCFSTRVCFRTRVKQCENSRGGQDYHCRFFYSNFTNNPLPQSCENTVFLSPPADSEYRTFCLFRVNLSSNTNCTSVRLQHVVDHPEEEYVDSLNVSHTCRDSQNSLANPDCHDYFQIYYGTQTRVLCRRELAEFEQRLEGVTSFVAVYWTDSTADPNTTSSFNIRAECDV